MGYSSTREIADAIRHGGEAERERILDELEGEEISEGVTALDEFMFDWSAWGRDEQQPPPDSISWRTLFLRAGRGGGKTRAGAEMTVGAAMDPDSCGGRLALIAPTHPDIRITMVEGTSGILACSPPWFMPEWQPGIGNGRLVWPGVKPATAQSIAAGDTVVAHCFSAERPNRILGPETGWVWGDEIAAWGSNGIAVHDAMEPGLRWGRDPRTVYTSTPKPTPFVEMLDAESRREEREIAEGKRDPGDRMFMQRVWSTWSNSDNLPDKTLRSLRRRYSGTTQGRQELDAELLLDDPGAAWNQRLIDAGVVAAEDVPELTMVAVAVDNALTESAAGIIDISTIAGRNKDVGSNDTGIVIAGVAEDGHIYVLDDLTLNAGPSAWGERVLEGFADSWRGRRANLIAVEKNGGGDLIERNLSVVMRDHGIPRDIVPIRYVDARDGKDARAEPIVSMYERGRVHHVRRPMSAPGSIGRLTDLEYQMTRFRRGRTGYKKDRVDALVWAVTALIDRPQPQARVNAALARAQAYVS